jgi:hypothetical protein
MEDQRGWSVSSDITCTFLVRVSGHSMDGVGIADGDDLVVGRSRPIRTAMWWSRRRRGADS